MGKINILIAEHDKDAIQGIKDNYSEVFNEIGYDAIFELMKDLKEPNDYTKYDVLIMDISWGVTEGIEGLEEVPIIKTIAPNLFIIANTKERITYYDSSLYLPTFDLFVQKDFTCDTKYKEHIVQEVKSLFKRNIYLELTDDSDIGEFNKDELVDILKNITFLDHTVDDEFSVTKVKLTPLYGGWSGSLVFKMQMYSKNNLELISSVLKVSKHKEDINRELKNYLKFVKFYLPYTGRPELIGYSFSNNIGAICYSFAYDDNKYFGSLSDYLLDKDFNKLLFTINALFKPEKLRWYNERNWKESDSLTSYYKNKWIPDLAKHEKKSVFIDIIKQNRGTVNGTNIVLFEKEYTHPSTALLGKKVMKHFTTICHGDLNTNNILISEDDHLTYIDFSETKYGHVFEDYVTFEGAIRTTINIELTLSELIEIEELFSHKAIPDNMLTRKYPENVIRLYKAIHQLRDFAFATMTREKKEHYFYALAFYCYRLLRIDDFEIYKYHQVIACMLVSLNKHSR